MECWVRGGWVSCFPFVLLRIWDHLGKEKTQRENMPERKWSVLEQWPALSDKGEEQFKDTSAIPWIIILFNVYGYFVCVCLSTMCLVPTEAWNWSNGWLQVAMWELGINQLLSRGTNALHTSAVSLATIIFVSVLFCLSLLTIKSLLCRQISAIWLHVSLPVCLQVQV